jgi:hypothetical protein
MTDTSNTDLHASQRLPLLLFPVLFRPRFLGREARNSLRSNRVARFHHDSAPVRPWLPPERRCRAKQRGRGSG